MTQKKAGVILNYCLTFVHILSGIIYVPLLLSFLTAGDYGVYKLMGSLIGLLAVMDFGLSNTVIRFYAGANARNNEKEKQNILALCLIIFSIITVLLLIVGVGVFFLLNPIFKKSLIPSELILAKQIYIILFLNLALTIPSKIFTASIFANEKFVFVKTLQIIQGIITPVLVLIALNIKSSVILVVILQTLSNIVGIVATIIYAFKKCKIKIKLHSWNKKLVKSITLFSSFVFLAMIVDQLYWRTDSLIIGSILGSVSVAIYSISSSLTDYFKQFSVSIGNVFMPQLSKIEATSGSIQDMDTIFRKTGRIQSVVMFLLLSGFIIFGFEFINVWTSTSIYNFNFEDIKLIYGISLAILIPLFVPSIQSTGISILEAKNKHKFRSVIYLIIAIFNVGFSIVFVKSFGIWGCILATSISLALGQGLIMNFYYNKIGLNIKKFFKEIILMLFPLLIFSVLCYFINRNILTFSIWLLGIKIVIFSLIFAIITYFISFNSYEKNLIKGLFKKNGPK